MKALGLKPLGLCFHDSSIILGKTASTLADRNFISCLSVGSASTRQQNCLSGNGQNHVTLVVEYLISGIEQHLWSEWGTTCSVLFVTKIVVEQESSAGFTSWWITIETSSLLFFAQLINQLHRFRNGFLDKLVRQLLLHLWAMTVCLHLLSVVWDGGKPYEPRESYLFIFHFRPIAICWKIV